MGFLFSLLRLLFVLALLDFVVVIPILYLTGSAREAFMGFLVMGFTLLGLVLTFGLPMVLIKAIRQSFGSK